MVLHAFFSTTSRHSINSVGFQFLHCPRAWSLFASTQAQYWPYSEVHCKLVQINREATDRHPDEGSCTLEAATEREFTRNSIFWTAAGLNNFLCGAALWVWEALPGLLLHMALKSRPNDSHAFHLIHRRVYSVYLAGRSADLRHPLSHARGYSTVMFSISLAMHACWHKF